MVLKLQPRGQARARRPGSGGSSCDVPARHGPARIGLPGLNGYEVGRRIRAQPWGKSITLIALTGWGQDEDRRKSREAGFDGHLLKPLDYPDLTKLLADLPAPVSDS